MTGFLAASSIAYNGQVEFRLEWGNPQGQRKVRPWQPNGVAKPDSGLDAVQARSGRNVGEFPGGKQLYICRLCHAENRPTAKFCRRCGVQRPEEEPSQVVAPGEGAATAVSEEPALTVESAPTLESTPDAPNSVTKTETELAGKSEELPIEESTEEEVVAELREQGAAAIDSQHSDSSRAEEAVSPTAAASLVQSESGSSRGAGPQCVACGASVRALDKFCIWCGEKQPERSPPQMKRCAECKTQLPISANFCFVCGNDVGVHPRRRIRVPMELFQEEDPELFPTFET